MFVSDLDGTVLMQGETQVKRDLLNMISKLHQEKKDFVVASGRSYGALKRFFPSHLLEMYFICENGALVQYQGKTLFKKAIAKKTVLAYIETIETLGCEWVAAGVHTVYTGNHCSKVSEIYQELNIPIMKVRAPREIPEDVIRISVLHSHMERDVMKELSSDVPEGLNVSYKDETWLDYICSDVDKGKGLMWLMKYRGLEKEDVAVFGDNSNDIEMMKVTPHSYAMSWAPESVKTAANYKTSCVMKSIQTYL